MSQKDDCLFIFSKKITEWCAPGIRRSFLSETEAVLGEISLFLEDPDRLAKECDAVKVPKRKSEFA